MQSAKRRFHRPAILLCFVISFAAAAAWGQATPNQLAALHELTQSLITLSDRTPGEQSAALDLARQRHDLLLSLAATSPLAVTQFLLPEGVAEKLPSSAQPYVETDADETGTLQIVVEDYAGSHKLRFFLDTGVETLEVYFTAGAPAQLLSGARIRGRGKRLDNVLLLETAPTAGLGSDAVQVLSLSTPNTFGAQSTAVLLINFFDDTSTPFTFDDVRNVVFTTVSNFDQENSQNQTWLIGDVFGWLTLPISVTTCPPYLATFVATAQQAATAAGLDLSTYSRFVYIFPKNACFWRGEATLGGTPSHALINGENDLQAIGHEMGHNFGLYHSHSLDCGGTTLGTNCQTLEYGDLFDIMGDVTASHFNAFQKERLGWLNYGTSQPITTVTSGGVYSITPYESGPGVKALKVLQSSDPAGQHTWYYVEYRQLIGFDAPLSVYPTSTTGVLIHSGAEGDPNSSLVLNMNPQGSFDNAALGVGETFADTNAGVSITTKSADASGASVDIEFGPGGGCHANAPLITVSPSQAPPAAAGSTESFTASVTNEDTGGCSSKTFLVGAALPTTPAGWTMAINPSSFALLPQARATAILQVTAPATTPAGSYPITISATEWPNFTYAASTIATYVVGAPGPDFTLVAPASVTVQQASSAPISVTSSVSNGFSAPVSLSISGLPAGVTAVFSLSAFAAPGSGTSTLTFSATASAAAGSYTVTITGSGGGTTHAVPVQVSVTSAPASLISISVTPANASLAAGVTQQFKATGTYSDGTTQDLTSQVAWSSSNTAAATISVSGLATGVAAGTTTIKAAQSGISGSTSLTVTSTPPPSASYTLFSPSAVPANSIDIGTALELGMKFTADSSGSITGIRFYKAPDDTATHVGSLWIASGQKLVSVTFTNETASGWQEADFSTSVAITANALYLVSYSTPNGAFSYTDDFFDSSVDKPPLHAPASATVNGNGVYAYGSGVFPTYTNFARNYWVDVVFTH